MGKYDFEEPKGLLQTSADTMNDAKHKLANGLKQWRNALFLAAIVLLDILRRFVVLGFDPSHIKEAVFSAAITSMATLFAFYVFFPSGKQAKRASKAFREVTDRLKTALKTMRSGGLIDAFRRYCKELSRKEEKEIKAAQLESLKDRYLTEEEIEAYSKLSKKALGRLVKDGTINADTKRLLIKYQKPVHCKPYSPAYFLAGIHRRRQDAYLHGEGGWEARTLALRPVMCVGIAVVTSAITQTATQQSGSALEILFSIALSVCQILLAAFSGYCAGQTAAEREELANLAKTCFVEEFLEGEDATPEEANVHDSEKDER